MNVIKFKYLENNGKVKSTKNVVINYNETDEIILDLETECLEKISKINNFILDKIAKNEKIEFYGDEESYKDNDIIKNIINSIIKIYQKEYNEIINITDKIIESI